MKSVLISAVALLGMSFSAYAHAGTTWSNCVTVTSVQDHRAFNSSIYLTTSPAIPACSGEPLGRLIIAIGQENVTADTAKGFLGELLLAYSTAKKVQLYYTPAASGCYVQIIANGGYSGQCN